MAKRILIFGIFLFHILAYGQIKTDPRQITTIKVNNDGLITWTTVGETSKLAYVIEQFRWNKWIKIGEIEGDGTPGPNTYSFKAIPYNGDNLCRVRAFSTSNDNKEIKWAAKLPTVNFTINKKLSKIEFNNEKSLPIETLYEIIDESGTVVKKGWGPSVTYDNLPKGKYILNYENSTGEFTHK